MTTRVVTALALILTALPADAPVAQQPARDIRRPLSSGAAAISGVIMTDEAPARPLRRARVALTREDDVHGRTVVTNDDGTFSFDGLPAGRYRIEAAKEAYLPLEFGARRTGRRGSFITLRDRERRTVEMRLARGAVISGTVTDADGQPAPALAVQVMTHRYQDGLRRLVPVNSAPAVTDDRGEYRIFGLPPGEYVIAAQPRIPGGDELLVLSDREIQRALSDAAAPRTQSTPGAPPSPAAGPLKPFAPEQRRTVAYAQVFYPGTTVLAQARPVAVEAADERHGTDFRLQRVPTATIQGTVTGPQGPPLFTMVTYTPRQPPDPSAAAPIGFVRTTRMTPGGDFTFRGVAPGEYTVQAQVMSAGPFRPDLSAPATWAAADVVVDGEDVTGVSLALQPPITIAGRVAFDDDFPVDRLAGMKLTLPIDRPGTHVGRALPQLTLEAGGRFRLAGILPGRHVPGDLRLIRSPVAGWWLKSILLGGREILDAPLDFRRSHDDAVVTFSRRASEVSGIVRDGGGAAASDGWVVVFSETPGAWFPWSRRVAAVQPSVEGGYRIMNLPPGDYFVAAGQDIYQGEWWDPAVLERLSAGAARIRVAGPGRVTQDVTLTSRF